MSSSPPPSTSCSSSCSSSSSASSPYSVLLPSIQQQSRSPTTAKALRSGHHRRPYQNGRVRGYNNGYHLANAIYSTSTGNGRGCCNQCEECPGFIAHEWRKLCVACRCSREAHAKLVKRPSSNNSVLEQQDSLVSASNKRGGPAMTLEVTVAPPENQSLNQIQELRDCESASFDMVLNGYAWSPPVSTSKKIISFIVKKL